MNAKIKLFLSLILTAAILLGLFIGFKRYQVEQQNKTVELVVDYSDLEQLAAQSKYPLQKLLKDLKTIGITSIGLSEQTLSEAALNGGISFSAGKGVLRIEDKTVRARVLKNIFASALREKTYFISNNLIKINAQKCEIKDLGIGFSEKTKVKLYNFNIIPRLINNPKYLIGKKISLFKGYDTIVFDGEEILGYPDRLEELAKALKYNNLNYGYVEIIKQFGNNDLKRRMGEAIVRVHGISRDELKKVDKDEALERFVRAVKERGIRMLYIRPYLSLEGKEAAVEYNLKYFKEIKDKIEKSGFLIGKASKPSDLFVSRRYIVLLGLGAVIGLIILLDAFFKLNTIAIAGIFAVYLIGSLFVNAPQPLALLCAIVFPSIAVINAFKKPLQHNNLLISAAMIVINIAAEAALGAILIVGLLADSRFMLEGEGFIGVKLALTLPIAIIGFYFFTKDDEGLDYKKLKEKIKSYFSASIPVSFVFWGFLSVLILLVLVARSGNFILPVLKIEKIFRSLLETILLVRPRFKEFMIGYPVLYLGALLFFLNQKKWLWLILAIATIAPVSLINSFTHIHTPLMVSIIRSINGLILGIIIGFFASLAIRK